jgi:hypothetical protein
LGRLAAGIVDFLTYRPPNDIMDAVKSGSLYADTLQENWRHQLMKYNIVSFYEGLGKGLGKVSLSTFKAKYI